MSWCAGRRRRVPAAWCSGVRWRSGAPCATWPDGAVSPSSSWPTTPPGRTRSGCCAASSTGPARRGRRAPLMHRCTTTSSPSPTRWPPSSTRPSPSRTPTRGCWPTPPARTSPTPPASPPSSGAGCRRRCSPASAPAASSAASPGRPSRCSCLPIPAARCPGSWSPSARVVSGSAPSGPWWPSGPSPRWSASSARRHPSSRCTS